ncbi:hypothetical protein V6N11_008726 [Hibiscus sabdariffa]|uniref:Protein kinase domain-containing protein n=1 Tax=Hibiscus sabdariffa TaxID=183260 RepID=A0ABR2NQF8_9ROSI
MEEGFQVKWKENTEACRKCNASGGACGFDSFGRPLCYCPQYQSHDECGHRDHVRSKGKLKEKAVIMSISVIVTGGIALLAFWFYVRKINVREAGNVTFPVVETNLLHSHNDSFSLASILSTIMEEGFQVKWKENTEACRKCNASGGACGFDSFGRPLCYCPQYQSHDECGDRDHVRSKGKLKENAVIISISVIVTGGIALLAFWFYVRKINVREAGNNVLPWSSRMKIIDGIVKGILYLHHESRLKIVHRNLKPANILLDENMNPKITNFGLSRLLGEDESRAIATRMAGTWYAWRLLKQNKTFEFIDTALGNSYDSAQVIRCYKIALLCVQDNPRDRPYMSEVVFLLHNDSELPEPNMPRYLGRTTSRISTSRNGPISICEPTSMTIYGR